MKRFFLIGGFIGFILAFTSSFTAAGNLNLALRDGMFGCLLLAFGFRVVYRQLELGALHILKQETKENLERAQSKNGDQELQVNH